MGQPLRTLVIALDSSQPSPVACSARTVNIPSGCPRFTQVSSTPEAAHSLLNSVCMHSPVLKLSTPSRRAETCRLVLTQGLPHDWERQCRALACSARCVNDKAAGQIERPLTMLGI